MKSLQSFYNPDHPPLFKTTHQLPEFFEINLQDPARIVKVLHNDPQANIRIFYYQYLKLCFQLQNINFAMYISKIEEIINNQDFKFVFAEEDDPEVYNDVQFKSLMMQFFGLLGQEELDIQEAINAYILMDTVFIYFFRSFLILTGKTDSLTSFMEKRQLLGFLCEYFEVEINIHQNCIKYVQADIFVYEEEPKNIYMAFMDYKNMQPHSNPSDNSDKNITISPQNYNNILQKVQMITSQSIPSQPQPQPQPSRSSTTGHPLSYSMNNGRTIVNSSYIASQFIDYTSSPPVNLSHYAKTNLKSSGDISQDINQTKINSFKPSQNKSQSSNEQKHIENHNHSHKSKQQPLQSNNTPFNIQQYQPQLNNDATLNKIKKSSQYPSKIYQIQNKVTTNYPKNHPQTYYSQYYNINTTYMPQKDKHLNSDIRVDTDDYKSSYLANQSTTVDYKHNNQVVDYKKDNLFNDYYQTFNFQQEIQETKYLDPISGKSIESQKSGQEAQQIVQDTQKIISEYKFQTKPYITSALPPIYPKPKANLIIGADSPEVKSQYLLMSYQPPSSSSQPLQQSQPSQPFQYVSSSNHNNYQKKQYVYPTTNNQYNAYTTQNNNQYISGSNYKNNNQYSSNYNYYDKYSNKQYDHQYDNSNQYNNYSTQHYTASNFHKKSSSQYQHVQTEKQFTKKPSSSIPLPSSSIPPPSLSSFHTPLYHTKSPTKTKEYSNDYNIQSNYTKMTTNYNYNDYGGHPLQLDVSHQFTNSITMKVMAEPHGNNVRQIREKARNYRNSLYQLLK